MSLIKILILSNALDPTLSLEAIFAAFQIVDADQRQRDADQDRARTDPWEPDDAGVENLRAAFWV